MKYINEVIIDLPRAKVIELFDNHENMKEWQEGFISFEPLQGQPGANGSTALLKYKMGSREMELKETIINRNLPHEFDATFEMKNAFNLSKHRFYNISDNQTRWVNENEFRFRGFMRIVGLLMPGAFKRQTQKFMEAFKRFAENSRNT